MALFGNSASGKRLPEYRVAALASLDLEKYIEENPLEVTNPGHIEWMVTDNYDGYIATRGAIRVPVEMYYAPVEDGTDPVIERVVINGKRVFDSRVVEEEEEPDYGIDKDKMRAETFVRYRSNMER